jgi:tRNA (guanine26-N2/guanine27-N2)-dimethyltransferase
MSIAGPLWLGKLWIKEFHISMRRLAEEKKLKNQKRILKFLSLIENEMNAPATYYVVDKICDRFNLSVPSLYETIEALREAGFQATRSHFNSKAFRTNAPAKVVKETVIRLSSLHKSNLR